MRIKTIASSERERVPSALAAVTTCESSWALSLIGVTRYAGWHLRSMKTLRDGESDALGQNWRLGSTTRDEVVRVQHCANRHLRSTIFREMIDGKSRSFLFFS